MNRDEWISELTSFSESSADERLALTPGEAKELSELLTPVEVDDANQD